MTDFLISHDRTVREGEETILSFDAEGVDENPARVGSVDRWAEGASLACPASRTLMALDMVAGHAFLEPGTLRSRVSCRMRRPDAEPEFSLFFKEGWYGRTAENSEKSRPYTWGHPDPPKDCSLGNPVRGSSLATARTF
jgi:hypothetical protein